MSNSMGRIVFLLAIFGASMLSSLNHQISLGPDVYYLKRTRPGGSRQTGFLYGGEGIYQRVKPWGFYWGLHGLYAHGTLNGQSRRGPTESRMTDGEVEARLGYTLQWQGLITPFLGYSYLSEVNDFCPPSPIAVRFHNHLQYFIMGLRFKTGLGQYFRISCLFKAGYMIDGRCRVSDDPAFDNVTLKIGPEWQYRVDLPLSICFCNARNAFEAAVAPFYWFRHYDGMANYPFDFLETRIRIYGIRAYLSCHF